MKISVTDGPLQLDKNVTLIATCFKSKFDVATLFLFGLTLFICCSNIVPRMIKVEVENIVNIVIINIEPVHDLL